MVKIEKWLTRHCVFLYGYVSAKRDLFVSSSLREGSAFYGLTPDVSHVYATFMASLHMLNFSALEVIITFIWQKVHCNC